MRIATLERPFSYLPLLGLLFLFVPNTAIANDLVLLTGRFPTQFTTLQFNHEFAAFLLEGGVHVTIDSSSTPHERTKLLRKESELRGLLEEARIAIDTLEIDQALKNLLAFSAELNALPFYTVQHAQLGRTGFLLLGIAHHLLGMKAKSMTAFQDALALDPKLTLPQTYQNPTIQSLFNQAKQAVSAVPKNKTTIQTSPQNSVILHNGLPVGEAQVVLENLPLGTHFITAVHSNHRSATTQIVITEKSREGNVMLKLHPFALVDPHPNQPYELLRKDCQATPETTFVVVRRDETSFLLARFNCSLGKMSERAFPVSSPPEKESSLQAMKRWLLQVDSTPSLPPPTTSESFTGLRFWTGTIMGIGLVAAGGTLGYLAAQTEADYHRTTQDGLGIDHDKTTDQVEGHPLATRGKAMGLGADVAISLGLGTLITVVLLEILGDNTEIRTTSRTSSQGTNFEVSISF